MIKLSHPTKIIKGSLQLVASKSESNRALIIRKLCDSNYEIKNLSDAEDTSILYQLLENPTDVLDVNMAGTAMRFLTALKSISDGETVLSGNYRMKERPISVLVDALRMLGADISYLEKEGFPPLKVIGKELEGGEVSINGNVSSQFISALLMIAPKLNKGLKINLLGDVISKPYIEMTIKMMRYFGAIVSWNNNLISVEHGNYVAKNFIVEADWSSASYWYSMVAFAQEADLTILGLKKDSLQGDAVVQQIYKNFGVNTEFINDGVRLTKPANLLITPAYNFDFTNCPDLAQTVIVTCAGLNIKAKCTGLKSLRIKETDRIIALQNELNKLGFNVEINGETIIVNPIEQISWSDKIIKTYNDHRMAMAFAPLALINDTIIENPEVVNKSYPNFWEDVKLVGFIIN